MNHLQKCCQIISDTFDLSVAAISQDEKILFEIKKSFLINPLLTLQVQKKNYIQLILNTEDKDLRVRKSMFFEKFILLNIDPGVVVIGPCLSSEIGEDRILSLIKDYQATQLTEEILQYYHSLPIFTTQKIIQMATMINLILCDSIPEEISIQEDYFSKIPLKYRERSEEAYDDNNFIHSIHERSFEKKILEIVKSGDIERLDNQFNYYKDEEEVALYSKTSRIRSLKNHLYTMIALISRAAIDGGLHSEIALEMCDRYILKIEEAYSAEEIYSISATILSDFTSKVRESQNQNYSLVIKKAIHYIVNNVTNDLLNQSIADYANVNPNYLSRLFKEETGDTLSTFIQKARIDEAKYLLHSTNASISDLSELLHFSDQSYFTKIFKKHTGLTPQQFRKKS